MKRAVPVLLAASSLGLASGAAAKAPAPGAYTPKGAWSLVSAPGLHPPRLLTRGRTVSSKLARGLFLLGNFPAGGPGLMIGQSGPLILDDHLQPVWFQPVSPSLVSSNLQQETYQGQPVLVWWQGTITSTGGTTSGEVVVVDQHYRRVATVKARPPWVISIHDAVISGTSIWVSVYREVQGQNLAAYGGPRHGIVYDAGVQEYDLRTGKLLDTWDALNPSGRAHVPLAASEQPASVRTGPGGSWDAYHLNSIQVLPDNQLLISMRNTWAAYLVNAPTGKVIWTLGGKPGYDNFTFTPSARFSWQHDVQLVSPSELTLFADNCCKELPSGKLAPANGHSEGMALRLDLIHRKVSLVDAYAHRPNLASAFLGSMQLLPNGNALVGFGSLPYLTEYTRTGQQVLDAVFPGVKDQSYRALFTSTWVGTPSYRPAAAARVGRSGTTVYASWNGATLVAAWQVLAGPSANRLKLVATKPKSGFETAIPLGRGNYRAFEVEALDATHHVLGASRTFG